MDFFKTCIIATCISLAGASSRAQEVVFTELPTQEQLPVANIHRILQDSEGYMWYGTEGGGLCRDDGYKVEVFRSDALTPKLLGSNSVTCLAEGMRTYIYIGTTDGLYVLDKSTYKISPFSDEATLARSRTDAVTMTSDSTVWVATSGQLFRCTADGRVLHVFPAEWDGRPASVTNFYEDHAGHVYVALWHGGFLRYDPQRSAVEPCAWPYDASPSQMMEDGHSGRFWVATWGGGVVTFEPDGTDEVVAHHPATGRHSDRACVLGMAWDTNGQRLWVASLDDLYAYDLVNGELEPVGTESFLPIGKKILDPPVRDRWGNVWVPGYSPHTFILSRSTAGIRRDEVTPMTQKTGYPVMVDRIVKDKAGYWIWQGRTGLSFYDPAARRIYLAGEFGVGRHSFSSVMQACRAGGVYASSDGQLVHLNSIGSRFSMTDLGPLPGNSGILHKIHETTDGCLWVAMGDGLFKEESPRGRWVKLLEENHDVCDFLCLAGGGWAALSGDRLFCADGEGRLDEVVLDEPCASMASLSNGTVWLGSPSGRVYAYSPSAGDVEAIPSAGNPNGDAVKGMATDELGHVWVLSDQYAKEYNPANQSFRLLRNTDHNVRVDYFHTIMRMGDSICLGGIGAFCMVSPSRELDSLALPVRPVVSAYEVDGVRHFLPPGLSVAKFGARQNNISFSFSSLDHLHARKVNYAYRLLGSATDWVNLPPGSNTVNFYDLPPGDYTLEVRATDMHGCWGSAVSALKIQCMPPWYATWWAYASYAIVLALMGIGGLSAYLRHAKRKQLAQADKRLTEMKFRFFTNVSHELRTPLTLIVTPLGSLLETLEAGTMRKQLESIHRSACELLELINQLLDFRKLETGQQKLRLHEGDMVEFVRAASGGFAELAVSRGVDLRVDLPSIAVIMRFDKEKMHRVLYNLLGNAFKFTPKGGRVEVRLERTTDGSVVLIVNDNGPGIPADELPHVFERYYQGSGNGTAQAGSGIGLHLVKTYVEMHGGSVEATTRQEGGAVFKVTLPATAAVAECPPVEPENADGANAILVVEDNDELRAFLVGRLSESYKVWQASNGHEALSVLEQHPADIVVSDMMMPGMDGVALCRAIKGDVRTSHVPVILLTAYSSEERTLEGYESGADCFLSKPFNFEILCNRIHHFIALQDHRKQLFLGKVDVDTKAIAPTKMDEEFLRKAMECVDRHLGDAGYGVEQLSSDVAMSRMNLYRKLLSLTGQKPNEFIRAIRLKRAALLLVQNSLTVTEVSERVGFSTSSYFSKCFRQMFGVLPAQYREKFAKQTNETGE